MYDQIHIGIVYIVSNGTVKASNPIFNHLKSHNEIFLGSSSTIQPYLNEYPLIPYFCFNFKTIHEIQTIPVNSMVDLVGLVISVSPSSTIRKRDGVKTIRRTIELCGMSGNSIDITLWVTIAKLKELNFPASVVYLRLQL